MLRCAVLCNALMPIIMANMFCATHFAFDRCDLLNHYDFESGSTRTILLEYNLCTFSSIIIIIFWSCMLKLCMHSSYRSSLAYLFLHEFKLWIVITAFSPEIQNFELNYNNGARRMRSYYLRYVIIFCTKSSYHDFEMAN